MSGKLSNLGDNLALQVITGSAVGARTTYLALLTGAPPENGTLAGATTTPTQLEVVTAGYARTAVTWGSPTGDAPASISNSASITFPAWASAQSVPITYAVLCDVGAGSAGTYLAYWALDATLSPATGQSVQFAVGALVLTLN